MAFVAVASAEEHGRLRAALPGERMMYEHGVLERILMVLEISNTRQASDRAPEREIITTATRIIRDYIQDYHEENEEHDLFAKVYPRPNMANFIKTLHQQHAQGRTIMDSMLQLSEKQAKEFQTRFSDLVRNFIAIYRPHMAWENSVLFPAYRLAVGMDEGLAIAGALAETETRRFGQSALLYYLEQTERLEQALGISGLASASEHALDFTR